MPAYALAVSEVGMIVRRRNSGGDNISESSSLQCNLRTDTNILPHIALISNVIKFTSGIAIFCYRKPRERSIRRIFREVARIVSISDTDNWEMILPVCGDRPPGLVVGDIYNLIRCGE